MQEDTLLQRFAAPLRGHTLTIAGQPGVWSWDGVNPGTGALVEVVEIAPTDSVLDLGCGTGVIGAVAAREADQGRVVLVDCSVSAIASARATLAANEIASSQVLLADGCSELAPATFDRVFCHLPRERAVQQELLQGAAAVLRPGGTLVFVAHRQAGVRTAIKAARELFGQCGVIRQKKGYHVAMAIRPPDLQIALPAPSYQEHHIILDGIETVVVGKPGVFAWNRLDAGTEALVAAMAIHPDESVLDLGCGTGLAGLAAARWASGGSVVLADSDLRAVRAAERTLAANKATNACARLSDLGLDLDLEQVDVVIANPPFHQDVGTEPALARRFIDAAARLLHPDGRLYLVANRFLPYQPWIAASFSQVTTAWEGRRYRVWEARAPRTTRTL